MSNFISDCLNGDAFLTDVDDYIDSWHESDTNLPIHEFLGMTKSEYTLFVRDESNLGYIVSAHRNGDKIENFIKKISLAARSDDHAKSEQLEKWLRDEGLWDE